MAFLATGTGLAPYMSMLRTQLTCGTPTHFGVLHGARHSWDLGYRSELMTLRQLCSNFSYLPTISRPQSEAVEWNGHSGYLQDLWRSRALADEWGFEPSPETTDIFICGNPAMVDGMVAILGDEGYVEQQPPAAGSGSRRALLVAAAEGVRRVWARRSSFSRARPI